MSKERVFSREQALVRRIFLPLIVALFFAFGSAGVGIGYWLHHEWMTGKVLFVNVYVGPFTVSLYDLNPHCHYNSSAYPGYGNTPCAVEVNIGEQQGE